MNRRVVLTVSVILTVVSCLWVVGASWADPQAAPAPAGQPPAGAGFPQVGKSYTFEFGGVLERLTGEVAEGARDGWVKVTGKGQGREGATIWVNLSQVRFAELQPSK